MKAQTMPSATVGTRAFTLIELLVVIAVIALLAGMIFPITGIVNRAKVLKRSLADRTQLESAIESYKQKYGHYPPDNPSNAALNQLYYELAGTTLGQNTYTTLDGSARIQATSLPALFYVDGFVNATRGPGGDEGGAAKSFLSGFKPGQVATLDDGTKVLAGVPFQKVATPPFNVDPLGNSNPTINPWRYNKTNPTNNPTTYDLWLDVIISGKAWRICNWSKDPLKVTQ